MAGDVSPVAMFVTWNLTLETLITCDTCFQFWTGISALRIFEILWHFTPETLITCNTWDTDHFYFSKSQYQESAPLEKVGDKTSVCGEDGWEEGEDNTGLYSHRCFFWPIRSWSECDSENSTTTLASQALSLCSRVPAEAGPDQLGLCAIRLLCEGLSTWARPAQLSSLR